MDAAVVRQFLDFFQDFLRLCQLENWPENETTEQEIKNGFLIAIHIEKCLDKLQKKDLIGEFLTTLSGHQDTSQLFLKNCFGDPPKYILKKIVIANTKISQMDIGFKVFLELFSEEKLERYLTDFMLEAASKETLLRNLPNEISRENLLNFKSVLLLSELNECSDSKDTILELLQNCTQDTLELLVVSLQNRDVRYIKPVNDIVNAFTQIMFRKIQSDKVFWRYLFKVKDEHFIKLCLDHGEIFKLISSALLDCGKLLKEHMSAEFFYIDLNYSELSVVFQKVCENENLKLEFFDIIRDNNVNVEFWENMIS